MDADGTSSLEFVKALSKVQLRINDELTKKLMHYEENSFYFCRLLLYFLFKEQHVRQNDKTNLNTFDFYILHREANFFAGLEETS